MMTPRSNRRRILRRSTAFASLGACLLGACLLVAGCSNGVQSGASEEVPSARDASVIRIPDGEWSAFGPFLKPAMFEDARSVPGPVDLFVPGTGVIRLDAASLLSDEHVLEESYLFTYDEREPILVGLVRTEVAATEKQPAHTMSSVIGISAAEQPRVLTRTDVFSGAPHSSSLTSTSADGVVGVLLEGELLEGEGHMQRLIGVDAARGTEVWFREHGRAGYGEQRALWYSEIDADGCPGRIEGISVPTGKTLWEMRADSAGGFACPNRSEAVYTHAFITDRSGRIGVVDMETGELRENEELTAESTGLQDPVLPLAVRTHDAERGEDLLVGDLSTGKAVLRIEADEVASRGLEVKALFAGQLYLESDAGREVLDARTGTRAGTWETYPVSQVGDYRLMSDGTLVLEPVF